MSNQLKDHIEATPFGNLLSTIGHIAQDHSIEAYVIGGFARDLILKRETTDIDFVCVGPGTGLVLAKQVAEKLGGQSVHFYPNFGTAAIRIHIKGLKVPAVLEFVGARSESYRRDSRKPIVEAGTLEEDQ